MPMKPMTMVVSVPMVFIVAMMCVPKQMEALERARNGDAERLFVLRQIAAVRVAVQGLRGFASTLEPTQTRPLARRTLKVWSLP